MIRYALKCREGHVFDSWFQSAAAYDALAHSGHLSCAVCGVAEVEKTLMTPRVALKGSEEAAPKVDSKDTPQISDTTPALHDGRDVAVNDAKAEAIAEMRRNVEENATYVGGDFAEKAREMHEGTSPETSIYGEASGAEARKLIEEGVPVIPLPFKPKQKLQ
jgi:hypothetical protein